MKVGEKIYSEMHGWGVITELYDYGSIDTMYVVIDFNGERMQYWRHSLLLSKKGPVS